MWDFLNFEGAVIPTNQHNSGQLATTLEPSIILQQASLAD
jgi:hypothetical protein